MEHKPNYYAIIPSDVRYDKRLKANCKLLYGEITALSNKEGHCWASNNYFAELYSVTPQAISKWIKQLNDFDYISINYTRNGKEITGRTINIKVSTNIDRVSTNDSGGYQQMIKGNNTYINNTNVVSEKPQIDFDKLLSFFNTTTGKNIRVVNDKTKKQFNARLKEGYTKADIFNAIKNCYNDDYHQNNPKYLTLEFISRSDKLEKYSNYQNKVDVLPSDWFHRELSEGQKELLDAKQLDMWKRNKNAIEMEGGRLYPIKLIKK